MTNNITIVHHGFLIYQEHFRFKIKGIHGNFKTVGYAMSWIDRYTFS